MVFRRLLSRWLPLLRFRGSREYWEHRYRLGGDSGDGSYGKPALYKAEVLNGFVAEHDVVDVIEFGCGAGHQLCLARYRNYFGLDVSSEAIERCRHRFAADPSRRFALVDDYAGEQADLALPLDVLFHLVEDSVYDRYLDRLFAATRRFVVLYTTSTNDPPRRLAHVRHRPVEQDVAVRFPDFERMGDVENALPPPVQFSSELATRFFFYRRKCTAGT